APASEIGDWVRSTAGRELELRGARVLEIERTSDRFVPSDARALAAKDAATSGRLAAVAAATESDPLAGEPSTLSASTSDGRRAARRAFRMPVALGLLTMLGVGIFAGVRTRRPATPAKAELPTESAAAPPGLASALPDAAAE